MKFKDGIILGMALFIGWNIMEGIDQGVVRTKVGKSLLANAEKITKPERDKKEEVKNIIGFRPY